MIDDDISYISMPFFFVVCGIQYSIHLMSAPLAIEMKGVEIRDLGSGMWR
jgi:Kef-type K+ transport system membrane component KefB